MRRPVLGTLFALACVSILCLPVPAPAGAITLTSHVLIPHGVTAQDEAHRVIVKTVAPPDSDDDGCKDSADSYDGPGCNPPPPPKPAPTVATTSAAIAPPAPVTTTVAPAPVSTGGCPSYMSAEATSPTAVNPTSGASGCYQVLPSTAAAMGAACSDVNAPSCVAAICAAQGNGAWASSGATPCG